MAVVRWDPTRELDSLQGEMNRLFSSFFDTPSASKGGNGAARRWIPAMDLVETDDHYVLTADLPGLSEGDINLEFEGDTLTLSGERKSESVERKEGFYRVERATGSFSRSLTLPEGVDPEAVKATFDKGVLEVRIPKPEQRKPKKVSIQVGDAPKTIGAHAAEGGGSASEGSAS
jgi:HSP20 family protein